MITPDGLQKHSRNVGHQISTPCLNRIRPYFLSALASGSGGIISRRSSRTHPDKLVYRRIGVFVFSRLFKRSKSKQYWSLPPVSTREGTRYPLVSYESYILRYISPPAGRCVPSKVSGSSYNFNKNSKNRHDYYNNFINYHRLPREGRWRTLMP